MLTCSIITGLVTYLLLSWNVKLLNHLPAIVAVIGRLVQRMASIASSYLRCKIYTYVHTMPETVTCLCPNLMACHQLLIPWCMTIAGYQISTVAITDHRLQANKQITTRCYIVPQQVWLPDKHNTCDNANTVSTVRYMSNDLICGYVYCWCLHLAVHKRNITNCIILNLPQSIRIL